MEERNQICRVEYQCKNSKNEEPIQVFLRDFSMLVKGTGGEWVLSYSSIETVNLIKRSGNVFSLRFTSADKKTFTISNQYVQNTGHVEDKSAAYAMFVRVLYMHLKEKSKARLNCKKVFQVRDRNKILLVILLFGISYLIDFLGIKLFHPAIHGAALSGIALLLITVSEKNKGIENFSREIPREYLPI